MEIKDIHNVFLKCSGISIDTRNIQLNSLFVAIKGERFDANTFSKDALEKGASFVVIDNIDYYIDERTILVDDSLICLQELAKFHRRFLNIPIIGLTGSNGKTTTKELINVVLSKKFNSKATVGNLNNHIGVPLTLLSFNKETEIGIVEMGANHQKEIEFLCEIAQPDYGYITNFGKAHLEGFGGVEGVIKGKSEMYSYLRKYKKLVFVNTNDSIQIEKSFEMKTYTFGDNNTSSDLVFNNITVNPFVLLEFQNQFIQSNLIGLYNANNIMAAITIGVFFKVPFEKIKDAIEEYIPSNNRSQIITKNGCEIILDAYNANPSSMQVAIENFKQLGKTNKVMVLGDMFELGINSKDEHINIINLCKTTLIPCHFIGLEFYNNRIDFENLYFHETLEDFKIVLQTHFQKNLTILIKGSRGMALERLLEYI